MNLTDKETITNNLLLQRFGPEPGQTQKLTEFYNNIDVTHPNNISDQDLDILIAMSNRGFTKKLETITYVTKVMTNYKGEDFLTDDQSNVNSTLRGYVGSAETIEKASPQQVIVSRGLDYEYQGKSWLTQEEQTEHQFVLQTGTTNGKPIYEPRPQVVYMQASATVELKANLKLPLDPRLLDRMKERQKSADPNIVSMATEIDNWVTQRKVQLIYVSDPAKTDAENNAAAKIYADKYNLTEPIKTLGPPYKGTGFSSSGQLLKNKKMNMIPEMREPEMLIDPNFKNYTGKVEVYASFSTANEPFDPNKLQGNKKILLGTKQFDQGKPAKITINDTAEPEYQNNYERVHNYYSQSNGDILDEDKFSMVRVNEKVLESKIKPSSPNETVEKEIKKKANRVLSKDKHLSIKTRKVNENEANRKDSALHRRRKLKQKQVFS